MRRAVVLCAVLALGVSGPLVAAEADNRSTGFGDFSLTSAKEPIEVTSKQLEFDYKARRAIFRGDVQVVQGDIHLDSDTLTVRYSEKAGKQQVESLQAEGNVKIKQGERIAKGDKAVYEQTSNPRKLVLSGNAVLKDGPNQLTGDTVEVYPDQSRMEVKGENRRVKVLLFPDRTPGEKPGASESDATSPTPGAESTPAAE